MNQLENCQARYRSNTWMGRTRTDGPDEFEPSKFDCILYLSNTHKLHGHRLGVLYTLMNGYSTSLHNIAPGKYIVIKVIYGLQLHFKIFLNKSDRKKQQQK